MAERVVLHVGLLKTGTSYLQERLGSRRRFLKDQGIWFPGWRRQVDGVVDVLDIGRRPRPEDAPGAWDDLVRRLHAWPGDAVVSMEFLGPAAPPKIAAVVSSLAPMPVQVVVTARDLNRVLPAMWQETAKNGATTPWPDYVAAVRDDVGPGARFWREQRAARVVRNWADAVGLGNVTVVTVPPPGAPAETLWDRFCLAAGLDPALCPPVQPANESLGVVSAEVLRRVNVRLEGAGLPWPAYSKTVKFDFAKRLLATRRGEEPALGCPVEPWLEKRAASMRRNLAETGVRVVGSLDDLVPVDVPGVSPADLVTDEVLDVAVAALAEVLRRQAEEVARAKARGDEA